MSANKYQTLRRHTNSVYLATLYNRFDILFIY